MRKAVFTFLKLIVALAALANLAALFVFEYHFPESWHLPFGLSREAEPETELLALQFPEETEEETPAGSGIRLEVPAAPVNYNGNGSLDLMSNVYVVNADGTSAKDAQVFTTISEGSSRREKVVTYTAKMADGEEITATRMLNLGTRYTGPSISVVDTLPYCAEGEAEGYAKKLAEEGVIRADDGFGNDITGQVSSSLKKYDASREEATVTLTVTNSFDDTYNTDVNVPMNATGIVFTLTTDRASVAYGETFSSLPYVDQCYDAEGNDLIDNVVREGDVDSYTPGTYECDVYCTNAEGEKSIVRHMTVTVEEEP